MIDRFINYTKISIIILIILLAIIIIFSETEKNIVSEKYYNNYKSIDNFEAKFKKEIISVDDNLITFTGILTGYGPDCVGCGGKTGCAPRQDVRNGNIYYNDKIYGEIRIVASDSSIPCGSIVKISNVPLFSQSIIAIVLDRGGAVNGYKMDLLYASEKEAIVMGRRKNVVFEILRWGW